MDIVQRADELFNVLHKITYGMEMGEQFEKRLLRCIEMRESWMKGLTGSCCNCAMNRICWADLCERVCTRS
jgi:hypothetical protein